MGNIEKLISISASICSLLAFVVLIFEKIENINLSLGRLIAYIIFCLWCILFSSLSMYLVEQLRKYWLPEISNPFLKISAITTIAIALILYYILFIGIAYTIITTTNFE